MLRKKQASTMTRKNQLKWVPYLNLGRGIVGNYFSAFYFPRISQMVMLLKAIKNKI